MAIRLLCLVFVLSGVAGKHPAAADERGSNIQRRIVAICQNLQSATVQIRSGSDTSSGVIVSSDGLILSVAHGLQSSTDSVRVLFPGGKSCTARQVMVDAQADVALLAMDIASLTGTEWGVVPVSAVGESKAGEVVLASGFPARESDALTSVVRLGNLLTVAELALMSSCTLTSGDSGGPLVNSRGELIGLHRQIGEELESNGHIPLTVIRRVLQRSGHWNQLAEENKRSLEPLLTSNELAPAMYHPDSSHHLTVEIAGSDADGVSRVRSSGTVLNARQVATKLSEIMPYHSLQCRWGSGLTITAALKQFDQDRDLAILELTDSYESGKQVRAAILLSQSAAPHAGQVVFAATSPTDFATAGIISRIGHHESSLPARFGATMRSENGVLRIAELSPNGSAILSGLIAGDEVHRVDAVEVNSLQAVADVFMMRQPGDWLTIEIRRRMESVGLRAQLQHEPGLQFEKTEFLDGRSGRVSLRRSGFRGVLQHDVAIAPEACGGPLLDMDGHLIAVNIARRARESTLAIPIGDVLKLASGP